MIDEMHDLSSGKKALVLAFEVFLVLVALLIYVRMHFSFNTIDVNNGIFLMALLATSLVTVIVYQSFKMSDNAKHLAERMAKDILTYSHELFTELYRGSPVPYVLIDDHGKVTSTNASAVRLYGCSLGEMDGRNIFETIESDNEQRTSLIPEKLKQGLFVNDEEVRVVRVDGGVRWVILSLFSFRDSRGARNGLLTLVDITKQKEIDKAKTEFVSLASHQLRTPISAMKWNIELLASTPLDTLTPLQGEYLKKIAGGLTRMENVVNDFLSASKFELGTLTAQKTNVVLDDCIAEILEEHYERARSQGIEVRTDLPETSVTFSTDVQVFTMAVGNLVSNAIKYTLHGGVVMVRATQDANHLVINISDTGMGIPLSEQDKLFSKIFRASNAKTQVPEGTGLGLYIAREAIHVLGGEITFVSKENVGTTFTIVLPLT